MNARAEFRLFGAAFLGLALSATAIRAGVEHVRGPQYDGIDRSSKILVPFPEGGPTLLWKRPLGQGFSGVIVAGERAFTQFQERGGQYLVCLDLRTGETIWQTRYDWPWQSDAQWPGPYATPTYADGRVFFAGAQGLVGAADATDGHLLWSRNLLLEFKGKSMHFGYSCTPLVEGDRVFFNAGSKDAAFLALNTADGSVAWMSGSDPASYSSPIAITFGGETQIVAHLEIATMSCEPATGRQRWYNLWGGGYCAHGAWPLWQEPYLFRSVPFRLGCRVDRVVRKDDGLSLEEVWASRALSCDFMTPVIMGGHIYGFDVQSVQAARRGRTPGDFVCLDLKTGALRWRTDATGHASVIGCGDTLVLLNEYGTLIVAAADPNEYRELARAPLMSGGTCWTAPTLRDNRLFVRNHEYMACYDLGASIPVVPLAASRVRAVSASPAKHWLDAYPAKQLWAPGFTDLAVWYVVCIAGIFGLAWLVHLPVRERTWSIHTLLALALAVSVAAPRPVSWAMGRLVFTWPVAMHILFFWVLVVGAYAQDRGGRTLHVLARALLILFVVACLGYVHICSRLLIIAGWGFLAGLVPAAPLVFGSARRLVRGDSQQSLFLRILLSFTVHFWTSALVVAWRANAAREIADY